MMTTARTWITLLLMSLVIAGCSKTPKPETAVDPAVLPTDYRNQIATYLAQLLPDRADFRSSLIGAPVLEQVGAGQHYIVCVMLNGHNQHKEKVVIYLDHDQSVHRCDAGTMRQCGLSAVQRAGGLVAADLSRHFSEIMHDG